jgi:hypothetical protein
MHSTVPALARSPLAPLPHPVQLRHHVTTGHPPPRRTSPDSRNHVLHYNAAAFLLAPRRNAARHAITYPAHRPPGFTTYPSGATTAGRSSGPTPSAHRTAYRPRPRVPARAKSPHQTPLSPGHHPANAPPDAPTPRPYDQTVLTPPTRSDPHGPFPGTLIRPPLRRTHDDPPVPDRRPPVLPPAHSQGEPAR